MKKKARSRVSLRKPKKTAKKTFVEPEIIEQEPLKRIVQQTCSVGPSVICFS